MSRASGKQVIPLIEAERNVSSRSERMVSYSVLALLALVAAGVLIRASFFSRALLELRAAAPADGAPAAAAGPPGRLAALALPAGLAHMGEREHFTPDTLFVKIDGKADLYLGAGVDGLECRRIRLAADPDAWMEAFLFDMASMRSAFSVYSGQRRAGARESDLARFAYETDNALFLVHGEYYMEIVAASAAPALMEAVREVARLVMAAAPGGDSSMPELELLPAESLQPGSVALQTANAFGVPELSNVFLADYLIGAERVTAFVALQPDPGAAAGLANAYATFLLELGGRKLPAPPAIADASVIEVMDGFEIILTRGDVLAGVHAAESREAAERLGAMLQERIEARTQ